MDAPNHQLIHINICHGGECGPTKFHVHLESWNVTLLGNIILQVELVRWDLSPLGWTLSPMASVVIRKGEDPQRRSCGHRGRDRSYTTVGGGKPRTSRHWMTHGKTLP